MSNAIARVRGLMDTPAVKNRFEEVLGRRAPAFISSVLSAVAANQMLQSAEPMSIISAAAVAASLDLPVNPSLGLAHIVPYKDKAQFQMGWKGFVQLAQRSGQYRTMHATPVHEGQLKSRNPFTGEVDLQEARTGEAVIGYLFYFRLLSGFEKYCYMTREECEAHGKRYSQSFQKGKGIWIEDFDAMALKTVVKLGLSKWGPLSTQLERAIEADQAAIREDGSPEYIDAESEPAPEPEPKREPGRASRAAEIVEEKSGEDVKL